MGCACNNHDIKSEKINEMQDNNNSSIEPKTNSIQNNFFIIQDSSRKNNDNNLNNSSVVVPNSNNENIKNEYINKKETITTNLKGQNLNNNDFNKDKNNEMNNDINKNSNIDLNKGIINELNIEISNNLEQTPSTPNDNYQEISTDKIPDSEFKEFLIQYPKIEDDVIVEARNPQENKAEKTIYYGEWDIAKNVRHGRGIQLWPDGAKYVGYWKNDAANGKGKLYHADGDIYEGDWVNDKPNGFGIYTHADGTRYEGEWSDDKQEGNGKEFWPDGAIYEGQYKDGKKNGQGKYTNYEAYKLQRLCVFDCQFTWCEATVQRLRYFYRYIDMGQLLYIDYFPNGSGKIIAHINMHGRFIRVTYDYEKSSLVIKTNEENKYNIDKITKKDIYKNNNNYYIVSNKYLIFINNKGK